MARSFKHTSIAGNTRARSDRSFKRISARSHRAAVRHLVRSRRWDTVADRRETADPWTSPKDGKGWFDARLFPDLMRK